ncbi:MAG: four helix bundle protein [Chloroflexota bacterium]|nr:four helix bundle protein [Chloroflexota bacterium]
MKKQSVGGQRVGRGFEDLKCWQLARRLMIECHKMARTLPQIERYDLASQVRRSSKSSMANISEGYGRYHYLDCLRFYYVARGSICETINHIITAHDLQYITESRFQELNVLGREAEQTLNGYIRYVRRQQRGRSEYGNRQVNDHAILAESLSEDEITS